MKRLGPGQRTDCMRVGQRNSVAEIQGFTSALTAVYRNWDQSGKGYGGVAHMGREQLSHPCRLRADHGGGGSQSLHQRKAQTERLWSSFVSAGRRPRLVRRRWARRLTISSGLLSPPGQRAHPRRVLPWAAGAASVARQRGWRRRPGCIFQAQEPVCRP
jgi:hypothetical protein